MQESPCTNPHAGALMHESSCTNLHAGSMRLCLAHKARCELSSLPMEADWSSQVRSHIFPQQSGIMSENT